MHAPSKQGLPRELAAGVLWTEQDEGACALQVAALVERGMCPQQADFEARSAMEASLHRRFVRKQVERALACTFVGAKQSLFSEWVSLYGKARADALAQAVKHDKLREAVLKW